ncbi:hypothetical protein ST201phi2-1p293 [Pseudomonas phage 201phi2-1]|uniref:Uncharacterized protein n=1 Tax=Pseudomonas phage 201phi2-1 TaxID=198110 RepID=B3FJF3_BP201|nr:hypothetical protein ST201phi2-1p293 [Pseudomonas phage 201phi2-1]ABY63119.1 hypothetical protein 201phi2-1p293 [Pseudomonas phage 201phi2-1]
MFNIWITHGIFYGYSDASIIHFVRRIWDIEYDVPLLPVNGKLLGTGLVLCPEESELDEKQLLEEIKARRIVPDDFPHGHCGRYTLEQKLAFLNHPLFLPRYKLIVERLRGEFDLPKRKPLPAKES